MIIASVGHCGVVRIITVVVVPAVVPVVRVERCHSQGAKEFFSYNLQSFPRVFGVKQLRRNCHGNGEVATKLVVAPGEPAAQGILVDVSLVHQIFPLLVRVVSEDSEVGLEIGLDFRGPVVQTPFEIGSFDGPVRVQALGVEFTQPPETGVAQPH